MIDQNRKIVFIHIPKTGGSSLGTCFNSEYTTTYRDNIGYHLTLSEHIDCMTSKYIKFTDYFFFTVIRNPFEQLYSFYNYHKYTNDRKCIHLEDTYKEFVLNLEHHFNGNTNNPGIRIFNELRVCTMIHPYKHLINVYLKYDRLESDYNRLIVSKFKGLKKLPLKNKGLINKETNLYTPEMINIVYKFFKEELDLYHSL